MRAKSSSGAIRFEDRLVTIRHTGILGGAGAVSTIKVESIDQVEWIPPGAFGPGYIRLRLTGTGGAIPVHKDNNSIGFDAMQVAEFRTMFNALHYEVYGTEPVADVPSWATATWLLVAFCVFTMIYIFIVYLPVVFSMM